MPRQRSKIELNLFPFLSVLCGLIAVLILMIINTLQSGRADASSIRGELLKKPAEAGPSAKEERELERRKAQLRTELQTKQARAAELEERIRQYQLTLELRKRQDLVPAAGSTTVGEPIGAPVPKRYRMMPLQEGQADVPKSPILVEVTASQYLVHAEAGGPRTPYNAIPLDPATKEPRPDRAVVAFLDSVNQNRRSKYLLLLVHEDGVAACDALRAYCRANFPVVGTERADQLSSPLDLFDLGVEPFSNDWVMLGAEGEAEGSGKKGR